MSDRQNYAGVFGHCIGVPPDDRPKLIAFNGITLGAGETRTLDLKDFVGQSVINTLQAVWIDNDNNARVIVAVDKASGVRIIALPYSQGWYPIPLMDGEGVVITAVGAAVINIALANVNIIAGPWKTQ